MGNFEFTSVTGDNKQKRGSNCSQDNMDRNTCDVYLPEEVLINILSFVDPHSLIFNCRLVCKHWKEIVEGSDLWRTKVFRENGDALKINNITSRGQLVHPWYMYYALCKYNVFGKNLLKNTCGEDKLKQWTILDNGGSKWKVENIPIGSDPLPQELQKEGFQSCFATSFSLCTKRQIIDLYSIGLTKKMMESRPPIHISDWFAARFDCGCVYNLHVELVNERGEVNSENGDVQIERRIEQWEGREWHQISHILENYPPDIRYIRFTHGGQDTLFWAGHYGVKISGSKVYLSLPVLQKEATIEEEVD